VGCCQGLLEFGDLRPVRPAQLGEFQGQGADGRCRRHGHPDRRPTLGAALHRLVPRLRPAYRSAGLPAPGPGLTHGDAAATMRVLIKSGGLSMTSLSKERRRAHRYTAFGAVSALTLGASGASPSQLSASGASPSQQPPRDAAILPAGFVAPGPMPQLATSTPKVVAESEQLRDEAEAQAPLVDASDTIQEAVDTYGFEGYAGRAIDDSNSAVILYWKGELPPTMSTLVAQLSAREGIAVEVRSATYSLSELDAESRRIIERDMETAPDGVPRVVSVEPLPDYGGLRVVLNSELDVASSRQAIQSPIRLEFTSGAPAKSAAGRWDDIPPFWGGAAIFRFTSATEGYWCTTGFSVYFDGSTKNEAITTDEHCTRDVPSRRTWITGSGRHTVGNTYRTSESLDTALLTGGDTSSAGRYGPYIYVHEWDSNTGQSVHARANPAVDQIVYTEGAPSGEWPARVEVVNKHINLGYGDIGPGFDTFAVGPTVGQGDSGGPVVTSNSGVTARGMIVAIYGGTPDCLANPPGWIRLCSNLAFHVNVTQALSSVNATIKFGP
jgi:hypothetical protein